MKDDFVHSFLFQDVKANNKDGKTSISINMDSSKEGWVGIPHGGIGMGAIMELAAAYEHCTDSEGWQYPVNCSFRMGGSGVRVGDSVIVDAVPLKTGISGCISCKGAETPYITGDITFGEPALAEDENPRPYLPENYSQIEGLLEPLPYYRNCFVCGVERKHPGLKRQFHLLNSRHGKIVCAFAGFSDQDSDSIFQFARDGYLHPIGLLAVLDETMGWAGFFASGNGGVSVRLNYNLIKKINISDKLVFFGRGEKVMGRIDRRMLFWASGCAAVVCDDGSFETVIESSGQWYAKQELTDQMRNELIPEALTKKAFEIARQENT